jgi:carboxymethylenebutenolidase
MLPLLALSVLIPNVRPSCCGDMSVFLSDPSFMNAHERPLPFRFQSSEGKTVSFSGPDGTHSGYFVKAAHGVKTAIVMVHEWWGLNDYIRKEAVKLHELTGYGVLAVDLYQGKVAQTPQEAGALMQAVDPGAATETVKDAVLALDSGSLGEKFSKLGSIGWCFGGGYSLQTAIQGGAHVKACVMFYGLPDDSPEDLAKLKAPVLLIEALKDKWISPEVVGKFEVAMKGADRSLTVKTYDADHGFANPSNPHYAKQDTSDAMARTLRFFHRYLDQ